MKPPLVTAVMVTADPARETMARVAIQDFIKQSYKNAELLIVNDSHSYEFKVGHPRVREIDTALETRPEDGWGLGFLRNYGDHHAKGDWIITWDDDDHHHPHRIMYQMAHRREGCVVLLRNQVRIDIANRQAICVECYDGASGTRLYPKGIGTYPDVTHYEDGPFLKMFDKKIIVVDNNDDHWPGPCMYVRFYTGLNVCSHEEIIGGEDSFDRRWYPTIEDREYLAHVLELHGLQIAW